MASFQEIAKKKVAGVPVIYLAAGFVAILAIVAWKMKPAPDVSPETEDSPDTETSDDATDLAGDYSGLKTGGTVIVAPTPSPEQNSVKQTNEDWERAAVEFLVKSKAATAGDAQKAIHTYLEGNDLTFAQGALRDKALAELKLPPEPLVTIGSVGTKDEPPAQKQFNNFPGKHTVKGKNDNTPYRLANLYYGTTSPAWNDDANRIVEMNVSLGPVSTSYNPGTVVSIPAKTPIVRHKTRADYRYFSTIAAANGISQLQLAALNPNLANPAPIGVDVRVR